LALSVSSLSFAGIQGGQVAPQTFIVSSTTSRALRWTAASTVSWLALAPTSGTTPTPVVASLNVQGLLAGTHTGSISVAADGAGNSPQTIPVTLTLTTPPTIGLSPASLSFATTTAQPQVAPSPVQITNAGSGTLSWTATPSSAWITVSPTSGTAPASLIVGANGTGLAVGNYNGTVSISSPGAANSPQILPVSLALTAPTYTISTTVSPAASGTVTGGGSYASGATVTLTAQPASGYAFTSWTDGGAVVSTNSTYTFSATANRALSANFTALPQTYTISTFSNPGAGGSTTGSGNYAAGSSVTVAVNPSAGYSFTNWTEAGVVVSTSASYTFTASANRTLFANFTPSSSTTYTIVASPAPAAGGTVAGGGSYPSGRA
jgi:hypothetical protein